MPCLTSGVKKEEKKGAKLSGAAFTDGNTNTRPHFQSRKQLPKEGDMRRRNSELLVGGGTRASAKRQLFQPIKGQPQGLLPGGGGRKSDFGCGGEGGSSINPELR